MEITAEFRKKMIVLLIEALKESPSFCNFRLDQLKDAVLKSEHQTFQQSKSKEEYTFYINEKLKKIKNVSAQKFEARDQNAHKTYSEDSMDFRTRQQPDRPEAFGYSARPGMYTGTPPSAYTSQPRTPYPDGMYSKSPYETGTYYDRQYQGHYNSNYPQQYAYYGGGPTRPPPQGRGYFMNVDASPNVRFTTSSGDSQFVGPSRTANAPGYFHPPMGESAQFTSPSSPNYSYAQPYMGNERRSRMYDPGSAPRGFPQQYQASNDHLYGKYQKEQPAEGPRKESAANIIQKQASMQQPGAGMNNMQGIKQPISAQQLPPQKVPSQQISNKQPAKNITPRPKARAEQAPLESPSEEELFSSLSKDFFSSKPEEPADTSESRSSNSIFFSGTAKNGSRNAVSSKERKARDEEALNAKMNAGSSGLAQNEGDYKKSEMKFMGTSHGNLNRNEAKPKEQHRANSCKSDQANEAYGYSRPEHSGKATGHGAGEVNHLASDYLDFFYTKPVTEPKEEAAPNALQVFLMRTGRVMRPELATPAWHEKLDFVYAFIHQLYLTHKGAGMGGPSARKDQLLEIHELLEMQRKFRSFPFLDSVEFDRFRKIRISDDEYSAHINRAVHAFREGAQDVSDTKAND